MCIGSIAAKYDWQLEVAQSHIDNDRYDMVGCGADGELNVDLSDQMQRRSIAYMSSIRISSANVLVNYRHRL